MYNISIYMDKYELSKEWIRKNTDKIKKAYVFAVARKYDIKSEADVLEILKAIDPINATEENAKIFSGILQLFVQRLKNKTKQNSNTKSKLVH